MVLICLLIAISSEEVGGCQIAQASRVISKNSAINARVALVYATSVINSGIKLKVKGENDGKCTI